MDIYYINLARRTDRRAFMDAQFENLGLSATRIEAVAPNEISASLREEFCDPRRDTFLSPTDLCCALSHVRACEALLEGPASHALILEDDAVLSSRLPAFLAKFDLDGAPGDIVRIETSLRGIRTKRVERTIAGVDLVRPFSWEAGAAGYVINRKAATILVQSRALRLETTDEVIFHPFGRHRGRYRLLQTIPGLCIQAHLALRLGAPDLGSDLNAAVRLPHIDASGLTRALRRIAPLFRSEIVMGGQRTFHQLLGARKRSIPFLP